MEYDLARTIYLVDIEIAAVVVVVSRRQLRMS